MISGQQQLQNKSECHSNRRLLRSRVRIIQRALNRLRQRRKQDSKQSCASRKSSTRHGKFRSNKKERSLSASEKRKRLSKRRFDNSKCSVNSRKLKKRRKKLLLQQLNVRLHPRFPRDRKFLLSTTLQLRVWIRVRDIATSRAPKVLLAISIHHRNKESRQRQASSRILELIQWLLMERDCREMTHSNKLNSNSKLTTGPSHRFNLK